MTLFVEYKEHCTTWKESILDVILIRIFPHLDTFYAVEKMKVLSSFMLNGKKVGKESV